MNATTKPTNGRLDINFDHRLCGMDSTTNGGLLDNIALMASRANSVLYILSGQFNSKEDTRWSDEIVSGAIDSVIQEVEDMKQTVKAFYEYEKQKEKLSKVESVT